MNYRKATLADLDIFFDFFTKSLKKHFLRQEGSADDYTALSLNYMSDEIYNKSYFKKGITTGRKIIYLAVDNNIKGYLVVDKLDGGVCFGEWLAVGNNYRKRGIATGLLKIWEQEVLKQGGHMVYVYTEKRNMQYYKNRGFNYVGLIPKSWYGADHYFFYKTLQKPKEENFLREYLRKKKTENT